MFEGDQQMLVICYNGYCCVVVVVVVVVGGGRSLDVLFDGVDDFWLAVG